jgi:hypothetical protein
VIGKTPSPKHAQVIDIMEALKALYGTQPSQEETGH